VSGRLDVALASCVELPEDDPDESLLLSALEPLAVWVLRLAQ